MDHHDNLSELYQPEYVKSIHQCVPNEICGSNTSNVTSNVTSHVASNETSNVASNVTFNKTSNVTCNVKPLHITTIGIFSRQRLNNPKATNISPSDAQDTPKGPTSEAQDALRETQDSSNRA